MSAKCLDHATAGPHPGGTRLPSASHKPTASRKAASPSTLPHVVPIAHARIQIQLLSAPAAAAVIAIGAQHPFAYGFWLGTRPLLVDTAVGNQLLCLLAMMA